MVTYDKHYQQENYFGRPDPDLVQFFQALPHRGHVLDLGCGQGRDALMLARLGFSVTAVDASQVGVEQMLTAARQQGLSGITGVVADIYTFDLVHDLQEPADVVLLDSLLQFYQADCQREGALLQRLMSQMQGGGLLCQLMLRHGKREKAMQQAVATAAVPFEIIHDTYIPYPDFDAEYKMYIIRITE